MAAQVESLLAQAPPEAAAAGQAWRDMLRALAESPPPGSRAGRRRAERLPKLLDAARRAEAEFRAGLLIMGDQRDFEPPW